MNGKKNKITNKDFGKLAKTLKIRSGASYRKILGEIGLINNFIEKDLYLSADEKKKLLAVVKERTSRFNID